jgi:hypothetical protein
VVATVEAAFVVVDAAPVVEFVEDNAFVLCCVVVDVVGCGVVGCIKVGEVDCDVEGWGVDVSNATSWSHELLPALEVLPGGQSLHAYCDVAPKTSEYLPLGQETQSEPELNPRTVEYVPAVQGLQTSLFVAPGVTENFPATHSAQCSEPADDLYFPTSHMMHPVPLAPGFPEYPGSHKHDPLP